MILIKLELRLAFKDRGLATEKCQWIVIEHRTQLIRSASVQEDLNHSLRFLINWLSVEEFGSSLAPMPVVSLLLSGKIGSVSQKKQFVLR